MTWAEWPALLPQLLAPLFELYRAMGIVTTTAQDYLAYQDARKRTLCADRATRLLHLAGSAADALLARADELLGALGQIPVFQLFTHGDLSPVNIRRSRSRLQLIDWGNSGRRDCLYDLFTQELFCRESSFWHGFPGSSTAGYSQAFHGWSRQFLPALERLLDHRFGVAELDFNLVCCCVEKVLECAERYRYKYEDRGLSSLGNVLRVMEQSLLGARHPAES